MMFPKITILITRIFEGGAGRVIASSGIFDANCVLLPRPWICEIFSFFVIVNVTIIIAVSSTPCHHVHWGHYLHCLSGAECVNTLILIKGPLKPIFAEEKNNTTSQTDFDCVLFYVGMVLAALPQFPHGLTLIVMSWLFWGQRTPAALWGFKTFGFVYNLHIFGKDVSNANTIFFITGSPQFLLAGK